MFSFTNGNRTNINYTDVITIGLTKRCEQAAECQQPNLQRFSRLSLQSEIYISEKVTFITLVMHSLTSASRLRLSDGLDFQKRSQRGLFSKPDLRSVGDIALIPSLHDKCKRE